MPTEYSIDKEDFILTPDVNLPWMDDPRILVDGSIIEEDRSYNGCSQPYRVFADLLDDDRNINDVNSAWRTGDSVSFTFFKLVNGAWVSANYSPVKTAFANEPNAWFGTVEWRDVLDQDGAGCFRLVANSAIAGSTQPFIVWGVYTLEPYNINGARNTNVARHAARVLSEFNDMNDYLGLDFTGSFVLDSVRLDAKIGYFNDNTEIDMVEYLDGTNEKVKIEDFVTYELRLNTSYFCTVEMLRMHLLQANNQWISDYNFDSYSYLTANIPVVLNEGLQPEFFDGSRGIKGVVKFKDKVSRKRTHFQNNRITAAEDRPPHVCPLAPTPVVAGATSTMLMGTGLQTSYRTGDDKDISSGRENGSFFTLLDANGFGNFDRFTDTLGGQTYANDIILDWAHRDYTATTVLTYYRVPRVALNWNDAIDTALALSVTGFTTGWYLPNDVEVVNIQQVSTDATVILYPYNYPPFNLTINKNMWSSTSRPIATTQALAPFNNSSYAGGTKTKTDATHEHIYCRHTLLSELGL